MERLGRSSAGALLLTTTLLLAGLGSLPLGAAEGDTGSTMVMTHTAPDGVTIEYLLCRPAGASADDPRPIVFDSHGWGGTRDDDCNNEFTRHGWGFVSIDQRGHGNSGGQAHVHDPDLEGQDNIAIIDAVAALDWVAKNDGPDGDDPIMAGTGGSYGGGFQWVTAFTEMRDRGDTRFDALAPEITWYDLPEALAPNGVVRTAWVTGLYAVGAPMVHNGIHEAYAYMLATGQLPDGTVPGTYDLVSDFRGNGPSGFVEDLGYQLDVPMMMHQGLTDTLFSIRQAHQNFEKSLTDEARAESYFVGFNGGHQQLYPAFQYPPGEGGSDDPCSDAMGGWKALRLAFFQNHLEGATNAMPADQFSFSTPEDTCVSGDAMIGDGTPDATLDLPIVTTTMAGAPQYIPLAEGPLTLGGVGTLTATATALGHDARAFLALAVGASPTDAKVLGKAFMPIRLDATDLQIGLEQELAGVADTLDEGETLYLVVTPNVDQFAAHGSRAPGGVLLQDVTVDLPLLG